MNDKVYNEWTVYEIIKEPNEITTRAVQQEFVRFLKIVEKNETDPSEALKKAKECVLRYVTLLIDTHIILNNKENTNEKNKTTTGRNDQRNNTRN